MTTESSQPELSSPISIGRMAVHHWHLSTEQTDDVRAAAKWAWKCLVELANVFCAHHCDPSCSKEGLPASMLEGIGGTGEDAREKRKEQWLRAQHTFHEALAFLPPLLPSGDCSACAIVKALAQFPKFVPFSPKYPVAIQHCNGVDCYPKIFADPSERSVPCCVVKTSLADYETMTETAVRERALVSLDLGSLPPIPPSQFCEIKLGLEPGVKAVRRLLDMREDSSDAVEGGMPAMGQTQREADAEAGCRRGAALCRLLSAVEKHRLLFLYAAFPQRMNPSVPKNQLSVWETVEKDSLRGWHEMVSDIDLNGEFLLRHHAILDAYAQEAISLFGPDGGRRPRILTDDGKRVDVEGRTLPFWSLEGGPCYELEDSSRAILDACAEVSDADTEGTFGPLVEQVMAVAHDRDQSRWYASVGVCWGYLSELDAVIDAIRRARIAGARADQEEQSLGEEDRGPEDGGNHTGAEGAEESPSGEGLDLLMLQFGISCAVSLRDLARIRYYYPKVLRDEEADALELSLLNHLQLCLDSPGFEKFKELPITPETDDLLEAEAVYTTLFMVLLLSHPKITGRGAAELQDKQLFQKVIGEAQKSMPETVRNVMDRLVELALLECRDPAPEGDASYQDPRRALRLLGRYWGIGRLIFIRQMNAHGVLQPHPLTPLIVNLYARMDICFGRLASVNDATEAQEVAHVLKDILLSGDATDLLDVPEWTTGELQKVDAFVEQARFAVGTGSFELTWAEKTFLEWAEQQIEEHHTHCVRAFQKMLARADAQGRNLRQRQVVKNKPTGEREQRSGAAAPQTIDEKAWFTYPQLAQHFDVDKEKLRKRLYRWQPKRFDGGWMENPDRQPREPKYLYQFSAVKHIIEEMLASS